MKYIFILLFCFILLPRCQSQGKTYTYKTLYPDGKIKALTEMIDGKKNGKEELYFDSGNLFVIQYFKDDLPVGSYYQYDQHISHSLVFKGICVPRSHLILRDTGDYIVAESDFGKNSSSEGVIKEYYKNGQVASITEYKDNKRNGAYIIYYFNGHIKFIGHNKNGVKVPPTFEFDSTGNVINRRQ